MAHDVFISYSSKDKTVADAVCVFLEGAGVRCWIAPRDIVPGKEWSEAIVDAITEARVMVIIFSGSANDSPQVRREVQRAFEKGLTVIPLRLENVVPSKSLEYYIGPVHWLDALTPPLENHLAELVQTVGRLLKPSEPVPAAQKHPPLAERWEGPHFTPPQTTAAPAEPVERRRFFDGRNYNLDTIPPPLAQRFVRNALIAGGLLVLYTLVGFVRGGYLYAAEWAELLFIGGLLWGVSRHNTACAFALPIWTTLIFGSNFFPALQVLVSTDFKPEDLWPTVGAVLTAFAALVLVVHAMGLGVLGTLRLQEAQSGKESVRRSIGKTLGIGAALALGLLALPPLVNTIMPPPPLPPLLPVQQSE